MKVLLDECLPVRLRTYLPGHDVYTVSFLKWKGVANGRLLALAGSQGFQAVVKSDAAVEDQQNPSQLPLSVVILHPTSNAIDDIIPLVPDLILKLGQITSIPAIYHVWR